MNDRADAMTTNEMTCQELVELVTDYLEDALPDYDRLRFEDHLMGCTGCRRYLEQMRLTIRVVGQLRDDDLSPKARDDLLAAFRTWKQSQTGA
jgi:hypothetical protein